MTIYFGRPDCINTIADAVARYGDKEFESSTRSTIPLLSMLYRDPGFFGKIMAQLGIPAAHKLFLEYTVCSPKGKGKASHTDVMVKADSRALAIEAKWTEPMYDTVEKWRKKGKNESNRTAVLEGWLELLSRRIGNSLDAEAARKLIYQMVHRAASAAASGESPRLSYFLFKPSCDPKSATSTQIEKELVRLWQYLGAPVNFPFFVVEIEMEATAAFAAVKDLPKKKSTTSEQVVAALMSDEPLFHFKDFSIKSIGE